MYQKLNVTPYHDHRGRHLAEVDTFDTLMDQLEGVLGQDHKSPREELEALIAKREPTLQHEFTEAEAAVFLGVSIGTLQRHRRAGTGPEAFSLKAFRRAVLANAEDAYAEAKWTGGTGKADDLRYRRMALEAWVDGARSTV